MNDEVIQKMKNNNDVALLSKTGLHRDINSGFARNVYLSLIARIVKFENKNQVIEHMLFNKRIFQ